jgi:3-oxoacyl-[acyl-carrier protein] reductase
MKTIVLTGATSGIGKAMTTKLLQQRDCNVIICGRSENKINELLASFNSRERKRVFAKAFDLLDEHEIVQFIKEGRQQFGDVDILINNAGANTARANIEDLKTEELDYLIKLNDD